VSGIRADLGATSSQFSGHLIDGASAWKWLHDSVDSAPSEVSICSAFIRSEAISTLFPSVGKVRRGRILARWRLGDLLSCASDLAAYTLANQLGFPFYIRQDFHGKVFSVPGTGIVVGSANATLTGFGLKVFPNQEACTLVQDSEENLAFVDRLFDGATKMTDTLFEEITSVLGSTGLLLHNAEGPDWPRELLVKLRAPKFSGPLLLSDCFVSKPFFSENRAFKGADSRDLALLGVNSNDASFSSLSRAFQATRVFRWLFTTLELAGGELYFGALTECLHSALSDDAELYRSDVKNLLQNLLEWSEFLGDGNVLVDQPNFSQRIRLNPGSTAFIENA